MDKAAEDHLPEIYADRYEMERSQSSARIAVSQLVSYMRAMYVAAPEEREMSKAAGPVVNFLMMLPDYGLSIKWAVSAAMLSFLEVMTNQKLANLNLDDSGEFDKRMKRLNLALRAKGIEIPALMLTGLYKVRSKVVHEGKEPTSEKMRAIFDLLTSLHEKSR
ncbi:MAG TPA: hypothetical protein VFV92_08000 [Candidatus Bathyarchaeia archaeon]|nr:hypothetical protein [Candidatus Bathyarchaeia archaeon]